MESHERQLCEDSKESVEAKAELANGSEKAVISTRRKPSRARLLRRCTSQCLLLNDNQKDQELNVKIKQDSTISSSTSGLLFTRPLSSFAKQRSKPLALHSRPKTSLSNSLGARSKISNAEEPNVRQSKTKPSTPTRTSVPSLRRQSSYFSLQSIQRSLSVDQSSRRFTRKGARDANNRKFSRGSFMGLVTSIDEEEREERRQLVMHVLCYLPEGREEVEY